MTLRTALGAMLSMAVGAISLSAQTAITSATTSSIDGADEVVNSRNYLNQTLSLDSFDAGGETYVITGSADAVFVRRGGSGSNNAHIWYDTTSNASDRYAGYANNIEDAILANNLHIGTHNLFANTGSSSANIERVDLMSTGGFTAGEGFAIPVFDFGVNPQHESFKIALVTGGDGSGNPTAIQT